jgi:hypothetical protein
MGSSQTWSALADLVSTVFVANWSAKKMESNNPASARCARSWQ